MQRRNPLESLVSCVRGCWPLSMLEAVVEPRNVAICKSAVETRIGIEIQISILNSQLAARLRCDVHTNESLRQSPSLSPSPAPALSLTNRLTS